MLLLSNPSPQGTKLLIDGTLERSEDQARFLDAIEQVQGALELSFCNLNHLNRSLLLVLTDFPGRLTIITDSRRLWLYLLPLGFHVQWSRPTLPTGYQRHILAIGIGGSAGSLQALQVILPQLSLFDVAIFLVLHQQPGRKSLLQELLQTDCRYRVIDPASGTAVERGCIYIAPADQHMIVSNGVIYLTRSPKVASARPSIEVCFKSLCLEYQDNLLALILTGYGHDGVGALKDLREAGSMIWIQDPATAQAASLPQAASAVGVHDRLVPLQEVATHLSLMLESQGPTPQLVGLEGLLREVKNIYGYDFTGYDPASMTRRVLLSMGRCGFTRLEDFRREIVAKETLFQDFFSDASINVTQFFREPVRLKDLQVRVFPYLQTYTHCKIWVAGCATGEEAYSLAVLLDEAGLLEKTQIYATDFNAQILAQAQNGLYSPEEFHLFRQGYYKAGGTLDPESYFTPHRGLWELEGRIRKKVLFFQHNLISDGVMNQFNLVLLRNVMIYFQPETKLKVLQLVRQSLLPNGFLLVGETEKLSPEQSAGFRLSASDYLYQNDVPTENHVA